MVAGGELCRTAVGSSISVAPSGLIRGRVQVDFETFQSPRARSPRKSEHTVVIRRSFSAELHSDGLRIDFKSYMPVAAPDARGAPKSEIVIDL